MSQILFIHWSQLPVLSFFTNLLLNIKFGTLDWKKLEGQKLLESCISLMSWLFLFKTKCKLHSFFGSLVNSLLSHLSKLINTKPSFDLATLIINWSNKLSKYREKCFMSHYKLSLMFRNNPFIFLTYDYTIIFYAIVIFQQETSICN